MLGARPRILLSALPFWTPMRDTRCMHATEENPTILLLKMFPHITLNTVRSTPRYPSLPIPIEHNRMVSCARLYRAACNEIPPVPPRLQIE